MRSSCAVPLCRKSLCRCVQSSRKLRTPRFLKANRKNRSMIRTLWNSHFHSRMMSAVTTAAITLCMPFWLTKADRARLVTTWDGSDNPSPKTNGRNSTTMPYPQSRRKKSSDWAAAAIGIAHMSSSTGLVFCVSQSPSRTPNRIKIHLFKSDNLIVKQ